MKPNKTQHRAKHDGSEKAARSGRGRKGFWLVWPVLAGILALVLSQQARQNPTLAPTNSVTRSTASATKSEATNSSTLEAGTALSTNSPLQDPNFKVPDD